MIIIFYINTEASKELSCYVCILEKYKETFSLDEALSYLDKNTDAKIISGGTDVLIRIREGKIKAAHLMGIGRIDSLKKNL